MKSRLQVGIDEALIRMRWDEIGRAKWAKNNNSPVFERGKYYPDGPELVGVIMPDGGKHQFLADIWDNV